MWLGGWGLQRRLTLPAQPQKGKEQRTAAQKEARRNREKEERLRAKEERLQGLQVMLGAVGRVESGCGWVGGVSSAGSHYPPNHKKQNPTDFRAQLWDSALRRRRPHAANARRKCEMLRVLHETKRSGRKWRLWEPIGSPKNAVSFRKRRKTHFSTILLRVSCGIRHRCCCC